MKNHVVSKTLWITLAIAFGAAAAMAIAHAGTTGISDAPHVAQQASMSIPF